jgi:tripartite-type tricarboxylate transporter receptor subunit TctC
MMFPRIVVTLCVLAATFATHAQQYPAKPVRVLVGYAAGSSTDIVGRVMADRLGAYWKQTVIVENRGGAAGNLAADAAAKAAGDGYTLLFAQNGLAISAAALPNLPYSAERDLVPLAPVAATPHILIVGPDFPAKNVQELIARAKAEPGKLTFASSGVGNSDHLCGELFNLMAGISAIHVPYKGGAPAVQDVVPGRVAYYFAGMPVGLPLAKSGRARALGVTSKQRFAGAPDIPTIAEQGLPQYEATLWQGFFAPSSIDPALGAHIARDVEIVLKQPETRANLAKAGVALFEDNQANFRKFFHADIEKWRNLVKSTNLKLE